MPKGALRLIRCLPNAASRRRLLLDAGPKSFALVSAAAPELGAAVAAPAMETGAGEYVDFPELVGRALDWCGQPRGPALASEREEFEAVAEACLALSPDSPYFASRGFPGLHRRMARTLRTLRQHGLEADELQALAAKAEGPVAAKLKSLCEIETRFRKTMDAIGRSWLESRMNRCLEKRAEEEARPGSILLFLGSHNERLLLRWIEWAVREGASVTAVVDFDPSAPELFSAARQAEAQLAASKPALVAEGNALCLNLFASQPAIVHDFSAEIVSAADPLAEVEWVLRRVLGLSEAGVPWSDAAIYCRDLRSYWPLIEASAVRLGVPIRLARKAGLNTSALARLACSSARALLSGSPEGLFAVANSSYLDLSDDERVETGKGLAWASERAMEDRTSVWSSLAANAEAPTWLSELGAWGASAPEEASLFDWVAWFRGFGGLTWVHAARQTPSATQARDDAALAGLESALEAKAAIAGVSQAHAYGPAEFAKLLDDALNEEEFGLPTAAKGVVVSERADGLPPVSHLLALGLVEGSFPRRRSEDAILCDYEREEIDGIAGLDLPLPNSYGRARAERDEFLKVCAAPSKSLTLSYPQSGDDRDNVPAFYLDEVSRAMGEALVRTDHPRTGLAPEIEACLCQADVDLRSALDTNPRGPLPNELTTSLAENAVKPEGDVSVSPGELRDALNCSFQYAFRRRLKLEGVEDESHWRFLYALPMRAALPTIATPEEAVARLDELLEAELAGMADSASAVETRTLRTSGRRQIREWVRREFQARSLWPKEPGSLRPHAAFGQPGLRGDVPVGGRSIALNGSVAALADMGTYSVAELYSARRSILEATQAEKLADADRLEVGLYLLSQWGNRPAVAVEADGASGQRTLFVLPRRPEQELEARQSEGLRVVDLGEPRDFFPVVKTLLEAAVTKIESGSVEPSPGDHCTYCPYGEICRSAQGFGEEVGAASEPVDTEAEV